jgi:undecaprenyl-diphosphatase
MRARVGIYVLAGAALVVALVLATLGVGEEPGALTDWQALALGIVQGLTELLPISSSGHLILVPWLADWHYLETHEEFNKTFDVALHLGTLVAVVAYFRRELRNLVAAFSSSVRRRTIDGVDERVAWLVVAATVPAALVGAFGENAIDKHLGEPWQIAILLAGFGVVLWAADRREATHTLDELGAGTAVAVGIGQALALAPGVSRSGITISVARALGVDRDSAARFSFLLLVPITLGAAVYKGVDDVILGDLPAGWVGPFLVGTIASAGSGLLAIDLLLKYVRRHDFSPFVLYRLLAALVVAGLILAGVRDATF